jgi:CRP/FNR family transcriptional regulator
MSPYERATMGAEVRGTDAGAILAARARPGGDVCAACPLHVGCLLCSIANDDQLPWRGVQIVQRRVKRGALLYRAGDPSQSLYVVRSGCLKSVRGLEGGREQVTAFHLSGDLLGIDGIAPELHASDAIALEDTRLCLVSYGQIERPDRAAQWLCHALLRAMSAEIVRQHALLLLLGTMHAEERVAAFLLDLSQRYRVLGYSPSRFLLRMTRRDIGSYLGLKLETVSRILSRLHEQGVLGVARRNIWLRDPAALRARGAGTAPQEAAVSPTA